MISEEARQALDYGSINPRACPVVRVQLSPEEYDALIGAARAIGINTDSMETVTEKTQIGHNHALNQFLRLVIQGAVDGSALEAEPAEPPHIPAAGTRQATLRTGVTPSEKDVIESAEGETRGSSLNHGTARKCRAIVQDFLDEVYK